MNLPFENGALFRRQEDPDGDRHLVHSWKHKRYSSLQLSQQKLFRSAHRGGVTWMDLDHVEHRYLLSCAADASIAIFDTSRSTSTSTSTSTSSPTHEPVATITKQTPGSHTTSISAITWYPVDNGIFLTGSRDSSVKVWDANLLTTAASFAIGSPVFAISISPVAATHCLVAVGSAEADVMLCDVLSGGFSHRLSGHRASVWAVAWSPVHEFELITGGRDGQLRVWDIRRAGSLAILDLHNTRRKQQQQQNYYNNFSNNASNTSNGSFNKQNSRNAAAVAPPPSPPRAPGVQSAAAVYTKAHENGITGVTPTPDGLFWLSAGNDDKVRLWETAQHRHELVHYNESYNRASKPRQIAVSEDSKVLFHPSGSAVQVFEVVSGRSVATLGSGHFESINCCVWNEVEQELYTGSNDHHIVAWAPKGIGTRFDGLAGDDGGDGDGSHMNRDAWSD